MCEKESEVPYSCNCFFLINGTTLHSYMIMLVINFGYPLYYWLIAVYPAKILVMGGFALLLNIYSKPHSDTELFLYVKTMHFLLVECS